MTTKALAKPAASDAPTYQSTVPTSLVIQDSDDYAQWGERLVTIATARRKIAEWFSPMKKKASDAHREICDKERATLAPVNDDELRIKVALSKFRDEQERKRLEEQRRLEREQREREEQLRLEQAAELERAAQQTGDVSLQEAAEQLIEAPITVAPVTPYTPPAPKVEGLSYRETWKFEIINTNLVPRQYLMPDEKAIGRVVSGLKDRTTIPGVRVYCEKTPVTRTR